jgi:hypothetical protein
MLNGLLIVHDFNSLDRCILSHFFAVGWFGWVCFATVIGFFSVVQIPASWFLDAVVLTP